MLSKNKMFFSEFSHVILHASSGNREKQKNEIQRQRDKEGKKEEEEGERNQTIELRIKNPIKVSVWQVCHAKNWMRE